MTKKWWRCPQCQEVFLGYPKGKTCPQCKVPLEKVRGTGHAPGKSLQDHLGRKYIVQTDGRFKRYD